MKICQGCGKEIGLGNKTVEIRYGKMGATAHPHWKVHNPEIIDFFHADCTVAIRKGEGMKRGR